MFMAASSLIGSIPGAAAVQTAEENFPRIFVLPDAARADPPRPRSRWSNLAETRASIVVPADVHAICHFAHVTAYTVNTGFPTRRNID
jgi:hypothetical protein